MSLAIKTVGNAILRAACEFKKVPVTTLDTVAKEGVPYWELLAKAAMVATLNLPEIKKRMK